MHLMRRMRAIGVIVVLAIGVFVPANLSYATSPTALSDQMSRLQSAVTSSHTIKFTLSGVNLCLLRRIP